MNIENVIVNSSRFIWDSTVCLVAHTSPFSLKALEFVAADLKAGVPRHGVVESRAGVLRACQAGPEVGRVQRRKPELIAV